jgi:hypothetical protein
MDRLFGNRYGFESSILVHILTLALLLVVQDDAADWEKESAVMADIYSRSYINIAASNASHCGAGFLGPRKMPMTERIDIHDSEGELEVYLVAQQTRNYVNSKPKAQSSTS